MVDRFNLESWKGSLLLIIIAYVFSIAIRMIWVAWASHHPEFFWNGQIMINTNDGYFFASGVQREIFHTLQHNPRVPGIFYGATTYVTYLAVKFLGIPLDTAILYMPAVISSLVVIPIILIGRLYGSALLGFFAAILGAITWSYYNRTMIGYYDTDMFSAMAPMFILFFLIGMLKKENDIYLLLASFTIMIYPFLYDQGLSIVYAMALIAMIYIVVVHGKERFAYRAIAVLAVSLFPIYWIIKFILILAVFWIYKSEKLSFKNEKFLAYALALIFLITGDVFGLIWHKISEYAIRGTESNGLHFFQVNGTVREAGHIPFEMLAKRISGSMIGFILAIAGYLLLVWRDKTFILSLPLVGIGLFAMVGGLRFTVYAVPVMALGLVYLFYIVASYIPSKIGQISLLAILTGFAIWPNITHIINYKVPTVFNKSEVKVLDSLKRRGSDKDYVISWWDYGYPIWYYADKNTLIDGGKHDHDNYLISKILTSDSQDLSAKLSRVAIETYVDSNYSVVADTIFKDKSAKPVDPNLYFAKLESGEIKTPKKTRDIYFYLPYRMMGIFPTVSIFSSIDLMTGKALPSHSFYIFDRFKDTGNKLYLANGLSLDKSRMLLDFGNKKIALKRFVLSEFGKDGHIHNKIENLNPKSRLSLIYMRSYHRFLLLDENMYKSLYVQLFVMGNYNPKLFDLVESSPWAMVYRLKI